MIALAGAQTSVFPEVVGGRSDVGLGNQHRVTLRTRFQRYGVASARLPHRLRINRCGTVFTNKSTCRFRKALRSANLTGIEDRCYLAVRLAIQQEANLYAVLNCR